MFVEAIETAATFTRAIHTISRNYGSNIVQPGAATLFFVNADGWALTCAHVAKQFSTGVQINSAYDKFKAEAVGANRKNLKTLEKKYNLSKQSTVELKFRFMDCIEGDLDLEATLHPSVDVALLKFTGFTKLSCDRFPVFPHDTTGLKPGMMLCRLGYPFPEFTNYAYDSTNNKIEWSNSGRPNTPRFPIEGMLTRNVQESHGDIVGFEMSTPGLRGQSGGPAFDAQGIVWGMQSGTSHLDLNFDVDQNVLRKGIPTPVHDNPFLHTGRCVHIGVLKAFMLQHGVHFDES